MKVDCHTHWGLGFHQRDGEDPSRWLAVLDRYDVTHAVVLPHEGLMHAGRIAGEHDHFAVVCGASNGRMLPFCTACAWYDEEALAEVKRCLSDLAFRGIKFHPWMQGTSVSQPAMDRFAQLAVEHDVPILFHDGTPPFSLPSQMALLAARNRKAQIVLGHSGLFEHWREAAAAVNSGENVWACLCGPHVAGLRYLVEHCPIEQLLWGTDFGYVSTVDVYPYRDPLMDLLDLTDAQKQAIYHDNPARLLKLKKL